MTESMKAVVLTQFGGPDAFELRDVPVPQVDPRQVRVRVHATAVNPLDYQNLRLNKDGNGQYFGGGYFQGEYGNGGILATPNVWGLNTVVSVAVPKGTAVVGALKQATTVYRKGGVRVESTNSDEGKFKTNVVTTRIEERIALAVRVPSAIVKVTLGAVA